MYEISNQDFGKVYQLIEQINIEFSKNLGLATRTNISINEMGNLSFYFAVKCGEEIYSIETIYSTMKLKSARYNLYDKLMDFIDIASKEIKNKIKEQYKDKRNNNEH